MNFSKLTAYLKTLEEKYGIRGLDLSVNLGYENVYRCMVGASDYEGMIPVTSRDLYDIYSCSKPLTMTAVMQLAERGMLDLNDTLDKYLPEFAHMVYAADFRMGEFPLVWPSEKSDLRPAKNPIHIHELMSMTAGLSYNLDDPAILQVIEESHGEAGTVEIVKAMAKMPLLWEPGTHYSYALGHDVLAAVVEVVSGMSFSEYMKKNIFEPLGIREMYYQVPEGEEYRLSAKYEKDWGTGEIRRCSTHPYRFTKNYESGGAGLTTTVDAYNRFVMAMANGGADADGNRILKPESIALMGKNWLSEEQLKDFRIFGTAKNCYGYGLGVRARVEGEGSRSAVGEFGWDGAAGAYCLMDPVNKVSIFYAQEIVGMLEAYEEIHPMIRDLAYEAMGL